MNASSEAKQYGPGDIVVLRGLRVNPQQVNSALKGPCVGKIVELLSGARVRVRLHVGGAFLRSTHFYPKSRICELACIVRRATPRERTLGSAILMETAVLAPAVAQ